jgi:hypothetical protein
MSAKKRAALAHEPMYTQLVLFPERAEYLGEDAFKSYEVSLEHWKGLASSFRAAFEAVYERKSARVLLVHGAQGNGKTLLVRTLVDHFNRLDRGTDDGENLWYLLAGGAAENRELGERAVNATSLHRVEATSGWLETERKWARGDGSPMRVFLFDDAQKDVFVREWASLDQNAYSMLRAQGNRQVACASAAEKIVEDCRGDFRRSLFVLLSNDEAYLNDLKSELDKHHNGLAERVELPLPLPVVKEHIVRTNTNRLNQRSYWFCLDQGGPVEKSDAYTTLMGDRGFIDSFQAISRALAAQSRRGRPGRPANKNLLTLVTLGTPPADVVSFLAERELEADESKVHEHIGVWLFRNRWASALQVQAGTDHSRRASLVESEFAMRWVALDMAATKVVCTGADQDPIAAQLVEIVRRAPSIADSRDTKARDLEGLRAADAMVAAAAETQALEAFGVAFRQKGQQRSQDYEPAIAKRLGVALSRGLKARGALKPDAILQEYEPCAVTNAASADEKSIEQAIKRGCHVIEITAHLQEDMRGLDAYLADKVRVYAELLEAV